MSTDRLLAEITRLPLVDHHVHGALRHDADRGALEQMLTESDRPIPPGAGCWFGISLDGNTLPNVASFISGAPIVWPNFPRMPTTLVVAVPLVLKQQKVVALWIGRGAPVTIDTPASLSVFI